MRKESAVPINVNVRKTRRFGNGCCGCMFVLIGIGIGFLLAAFIVYR